MSYEAQSSPEPMAIASIATGILAYVVSCCCSFIPFLSMLGVVLGVVSVVTGFLATKKIDATQGPGADKTLAYAGMALGGIYLVLFVVLIVVGIVAFGGLLIFDAVQ